MPLAPLATLYHAGERPPEPRLIAGEDMPQPYRRLLVNAGDMTPTLEAFHGCAIGLRVLASLRDGDHYSRQVVLLDSEGRPVEFGAIRIHLDVLPPPVRDDVLAARRPLGGILHQHRLPHRSQPSAYFAVVGDHLINEALGVAAPCRLYGRCNTLIDVSDRPIAEVVEILPPHRGAST